MTGLVPVIHALREKNPSPLSTRWPLRRAANVPGVCDDIAAWMTGTRPVMTVARVSGQGGLIALPGPS